MVSLPLKSKPTVSRDCFILCTCIPIPSTAPNTRYSINTT